MKTGIVFLTLLAFFQPAFSKRKKVQEVNFTEMNLKGAVRSPDGAFLVQKRGIQFLPLHDLMKDMDEKIRKTKINWESQ